MRGERGFTIIELMMSIAAFMVVFSAILMMVQVATKNQDRVAERVASNQRARPVMTALIDRLHSGCVAPAISPVQPGSSSSSIQFISKSGSAVSPTPDKHVVSLSGTTLSESIYPASGGSAPSWTFSGTPTSTRTLLTGVGPGQVDGSAVPLFRYFSYVGGTVSTTPLAVPLSAQSATDTVQVNIAFASSVGSSANDPEGPLTIADSATLRLEPASEDSAEVNLPCV
jgi:type II secretory pathway pseudopilin PulG